MSPTPSELGTGHTKESAREREVAIRETVACLGIGFFDKAGEREDLKGLFGHFNGLLIDADGSALCVHPLIWLQQPDPRPLLSWKDLFFKPKEPKNLGQFVLGNLSYGSLYSCQLFDQGGMTINWGEFPETYSELGFGETLRTRAKGYAFLRGFFFFDQSFPFSMGQIGSSGLKNLYDFLKERMQPLGENSFPNDQGQTIISRHITQKDLLLGIKNAMGAK